MVTDPCHPHCKPFWEALIKSYKNVAVVVVVILVVTVALLLWLVMMH